TSLSLPRRPTSPPLPCTTLFRSLYTPDELARHLKEVGARFLFTTPQPMPTVEAAISGTVLQHVFVFGEAAGATSFAELCACADAPPQVQIAARRDVVALPSSSGTSGLPKSVMLTHYNMVASLCQLHATGVIRESDRLICVVPCAHLYGLQVIMNWGLSEGATIVMMPRFDFTQFLQLMQDYRITQAPLVPPIVRLLARHPAVEQFDLSHLKYVHSGGAPLNSEDADACVARL